MDTGPELSPQPASMHTDSETGLQLAQKHTDLEPGSQLPPEMHNDPKPDLLAVALHSDTEPGQATVQEEKLTTSPHKPGGSSFLKGFINKKTTALIFFQSAQLLQFWLFSTQIGRLINDEVLKIVAD